MKFHMSHLILSVSLLFTVVVTDVQASRADRRQGRQATRISQGVESGSLNRREARGLRAQQKRVSRAERRAASDGTVTRAEAAHVENMQDRASENIHNQKHDAQ